MLVINLILIVVMLVLLGWQVLGRAHALLFLKALVLAISLTVVAGGVMFLATYLTLEAVMGYLQESSGTFSLMIIIMLVAASFAYWPTRWILQQAQDPEEMGILVEYYIQWTTIFFTVYQLIVSNRALQDMMWDWNLLEGVNIQALNLQLLPVLLVTWVAIVLAKLHLKYHRT